MDERQYDETFREDEIDLRELFMVIWRKKVTIIAITLIAAILTGLISVFLITPVYHSRLRIIINMPDSYHTKYGDYTLPISSNDQYINLITNNTIIINTIEDMNYNEEISIETIRKRITIEQNEQKANVEQNSYFVNVAADNPAEAKKLAQTLFDNYIRFLDILIVEGALDYYTDIFSIALQSNEVSLASNKEILAKNEELLAATPQTINQKEVLQELEGSSTDYIILENIINPNYTKLEADVLANKQSINGIENSMRIHNEYLAEISELRDKLISYKESGDFSSFSSDFVSATKTNLYLASEPVEPSKKTSPSNTRNAVIGALLGGMLAVAAVLIKEYWLRPDNEKQAK